MKYLYLSFFCLATLFIITQAYVFFADSPLTERDQELIAWFDTLGFPDFSQTSLVRAATGNWTQAAGEEPVTHYQLAYLLEQTEEQFSICTLDLTIQNYKRTPPGTPEHRTISFEVLDLQARAQQQLSRFSTVKPTTDHLWIRTGKHLYDRGKVFVLARVCAAHGLDQLGHDLIDVAAKLLDRKTGKVAGDDHLKPALAADIGNAVMWSAVLKFGTPEINRTELLQEFQRFVKNYPGNEHVERAEASVKMLRQMVREDTQHAQQQRPALEKMDTKERVAELIFQLRDQNGRQWSQPGACDIFYQDFQGKGNSPATQLVKIGYNAVPQLIEALGDERFTRSVGYHRNFYFSHHVLRVGDCAHRILQRIAGRGFNGRTRITEKVSEHPNTKRQIQQWYDQLLINGEKQMLSP